jgi:hypothetical protein
VSPPPSPELRAYVAASRTSQGLPPVITDPGTLERVAAVLRLVALPEPAPPPPRTRRPKAGPGDGAMTTVEVVTG